MKKVFKFLLNNILVVVMVAVLIVAVPIYLSAKSAAATAAHAATMALASARASIHPDAKVLAAIYENADEKAAAAADADARVAVILLVSLLLLMMIVVIMVIRKLKVGIINSDVKKMWQAQQSEEIVISLLVKLIIPQPDQENYLNEVLGDLEYMKEDITFSTSQKQLYARFIYFVHFTTTILSMYQTGQELRKKYSFWKDF